MSSKVYFIDMYSETSEDRMYKKIQKLFDAVEFGKAIEKGDLTAVKVHMGERGNTTFVPPWNIRAIIDKIKSCGGKPFITDTNTLYRGKRRNAVDHIETGVLHGFTPSVVGAPIIIADGLTGRNIETVEINQKHFKTVKLGGTLVRSDYIFVSSHFKGHVMAGFGGAIKNLAMGGACIEGKKEQHSVRPHLDEEENECIGCGECKKHCPSDAILIVEGKAQFDPDKCIGCGECLGRCTQGVITMNWETEITEFTERMVEYAYGMWKSHQDKIGFINFVINVTPECDCFDISQRTVVHDIGVLASKDPVALDKACYDLVNQHHGKKDSLLKSNYEPGKDKFTGIHKDTQGQIQFQYAEELGMGTTAYELINLSTKPNS